MKNENVFVVGLVGGVSFISEEAILAQTEGQFVTVSSVVDPSNTLESYISGESAFNQNSKIVAFSREDAHAAKNFLDENVDLFINGNSIVNINQLVSVISIPEIRQVMLNKWVDEILEFVFTDYNQQLKGFLDVSFVIDTNKETVSSFYEVLEEDDASCIMKKNYLNNPTIFDSNTFATTLLLETASNFKGISVGKDFYRNYLMNELNKAVCHVGLHASQVRREALSV